MISYPDKKIITNLLKNHFNSGKSSISQEFGCPVCGESLNLNTKGVICLHHMYHDKKNQRKILPLFMHSPSNLMPYHHFCQGKEDIFAITWYHAQMFEYIFRQFKKNCETELFNIQHHAKEIEQYPEYQELQEASMFDYYTFSLSLGMIYTKILNKMRS